MPSDWGWPEPEQAQQPGDLGRLEGGGRSRGAQAGHVRRFAFTPWFGWMSNDKVVAWVDYAAKKYPGKVKFLNLREVDELLTKNVLGGQPLRAANGQDNGARILDLNGDGAMDAVVGNEKVRQTRVWSPESGKWVVSDFPVSLVCPVVPGADKLPLPPDAGVRFGILRKNGMASVLVRNETTAGLWHFDGKTWTADPKGLEGLELGGPILTSEKGRDRGVRLRDLDGDGVCELIVGNDKQNAIFSRNEAGGWTKLPFALPEGTAVVDAQGRDAGLRFVDIDEDGRDDVVFSNAERYSLHLFRSITEGWSRRILQSNRGQNDEIPMIVRADGTNNGAWFHRRHMYVQNEDTGGKIPGEVDSRPYTQLLSRDRTTK